MPATREAAHTPGQWDYFVGNANGRGLIRIEQQGTGVHIASLHRGAVSEANAALIAQAPALLAMLREVLEWNADDADLATNDTAFRLKNFADTCANRADALRAAIAKVQP